jgi:hypothetical protein
MTPDRPARIIDERDLMILEMAALGAAPDQIAPWTGVCCGKVFARCLTPDEVAEIIKQINGETDASEAAA